jgi:putative hydrolase of the HAD superfamily
VSEASAHPASLRVYPRGRAHAVQRAILQQVITFDAGQTLIDLDLDFLVRRLAERGAHTATAALAAAAPAAWAHYDALADAGTEHIRAWHELVAALLAGAGIPDPQPLAAWLWAENPRANLWRKPITPMVDLARELAARGAIVGVLSNSEGGLADLLAEIGIADVFRDIIDSGRLTFEKPDRRIFDHTLATLNAPPGTPAIHIGDSWKADIVGARGAGWRAIWYGRRIAPVSDPDIAIARDGRETRAALVRWGVL